MPDLVVAGAGMAGLAAAAEARSLGAEVALREKLDRPGGSMRLSSGVIWRHRSLKRFHGECAAGDLALQRLVFERLDADLDWLESLGAPVRERGTGNPVTTGARFDVDGLTSALVGAAGGVELRAPVTCPSAEAPLVLATGGFAASRELLRRHVTPEASHVLLRCAPGNQGDGLRIGLEAGGSLGPGMGDAYVRNMPAPPARVEPSDFVRLAQLYARHAVVLNARGERFVARGWAETDVALWTARQPRARAWYQVLDAALERRVRDRTVAEMVAAAADAGAPVRRERGVTVVETVAGVTTTLGGLRIDARAQAAPGVFACGHDAAGVAAGGYASGLAAALVLGRIAARSALGA